MQVTDLYLSRGRLAPTECDLQFSLEERIAEKCKNQKNECPFRSLSVLFALLCL